MQPRSQGKAKIARGYQVAFVTSILLQLQLRLLAWLSWAGTGPELLSRAILLPNSVWTCPTSRGGAESSPVCTLARTASPRLETLLFSFFLLAGWESPCGP
jgi:hypothetical protein